MNKNNKRYVTIEGKTFKSRKEACEYYNINYATVSTRLDRGWSLEEAITTPNKKHNNFESSLNNEIDLNGEKITIYEACKKYNIPKQLVYSRYYYCGWSFEEIFGIKDRNGKYNLVKIKNKTFESIRKASEYYKINYSTVTNRINRGWTVEEAITTPVIRNNSKGGKRKLIIVNGIYFKTIKEATDYYNNLGYNLNYGTVKYQLRIGKKINQVFTKKKNK